MKRILPAPCVFVTSSGMRPKRFVSLLCVARISVPAFARTAGAYHWKPGSVCQTRALASSLSSSLVSRLCMPASVSVRRPGDEVPQPRGWRFVPDDRHEVARAAVFCSVASAPRMPGQEDEAGGLVAHELLQRLALLVRQLAFHHADIAEEDHVVFRQLFVLRKARERYPRPSPGVPTSGW